ncbi:dihydroxyacetone kinase family protein [Agrobacterium salinitolerans]|uniref:Dihydroxyacetone kinase family protein n=1 Tax=Agrobacterium salinitolerans TaxID=1183413 RepID=A0A9X3R0P5_9HYPH|nr:MULTISPECIES: dihydroxyacetone kinase family protein [Agrobacterium]MCZ7853849.1 dihydroxyacetone kinase family protein [Agrobacterium salinitolerans]MCZ7891614.1 dihydroxyacetone kinase family protein [Agrobacterium salinitolerans]MCZ7939681.1 dihydroxyacetone kinase family protein [Agrobacterium salinitolerans]MCZ7976779.1 dihydroxyacetone kinase family protein [Agrobacterium salinitolerans]TRA89654.1 dihydroxyacetone kinase subunit DhaK [Agrobacterium salinitolerans]
MKKLINDPATVVRDMLEGVVALSPATVLLADENVVIRSGLPDPEKRRVAVLSGGGSGHEPAHAGYVGAGMLTVAVAGDVFTSPSTDAVLAGIRAAAGPAGALVIVKNYTGDRLNFGLAAELARAEGIPVEIVVVADDVALKDTVLDDRRRGIAGTVLVHKLAGAAAEQGLSLQEVARIAREAAGNLSSMGISLGSCTLPAVGRPGFVLGDAEIEVGLGIHGEQGVRRMPIAPADELVKLVLETIEADGRLKSGDRVALLVNGLGSTPPMELAVVARSAVTRLETKRVVVERAWAGTFLSALDMPGFSLSVMQVDDAMLNLMDAPTDAGAWPRGGVVNRNRVLPSAGVKTSVTAQSSVTVAGERLRSAAERVAGALIAAEPKLTQLDSVTGDGDLGTSMVRGAEAILALPRRSFADISGGLMEMANAMRKAIGGSSGPFYATGLMRASRHLAGIEKPTAQQMAEAFVAAVLAVSELGGAKPGDRTMIDALHPAAATFRDKLAAGASADDAWRSALAAGVAGAEATTSMKPRLGRASYLGERAMGHPDAGAVAVSIWLEAIGND